MSKCRNYIGAFTTDLTAIRFNDAFTELLVANASEIDLVIPPHRHLVSFASIASGVLTGLAFAYGPLY